MRWIANRALAAMILAGIGLNTTAQDAPEIQTVQKATWAADVPTLAKLYQNPPNDAARVLAAMALERIHYNLEKSSADAQLCERVLRDSQTAVAYFCALFDNGNLRLRQGTAVADAAESDIADRFAGHMPAKTLDKLRRYASSRAGQPSLSADLPANDFKLPLQHAPGDNRGALEVEANVHTMRLVVDTGAGTLTMNATIAQRLGVRILGREHTTDGMLSRNVNARAGVIDRMSIGPVTLHHVPVQVVDSPARLIGLDVLKLFGSFRITKDDIAVYRSAEHRPTCEQPLLIASGIWGNSIRATVALSIDGDLRTTLIDSGSAFYLSGDGPSMQALTTSYARRLRLRDIGPRAHAARLGQATAQVIISGQPIDMTFGVIKDASLPWHYVLGSGALNDMDFYFDFIGRHSCQLLHPDLH